MNYEPYLPIPDNQNSLSPIFDSNSCGIFGLVDFMEIEVFRQSGTRVDYSKRGAAKQAGIEYNVDPNGHIWGSYVTVDLAIIKNKGLLTQSQWPDLPNFSHNEFFAPIPPDLNGQAFLNQWELSDLIPVQNASVTLKTAPILLQIQFPNKAVHFVVQISENEYYDSYSPNIKPLGYNNSVILNQWTLNIKPKLMNQTKVVKSKVSQTLWLCTPVPDIGMDNLQKIAGVQGFEIPDPVPDTDSLT